MLEWIVAVIGIGLLVVAVRQARAKGAAASLQMAAGGFLLTGAAATGLVDFFTGLILNPVGWVGIGMLALAGVLFVTGQGLEAPKKRKQVSSSGEQPPAVEESKKPPKGATSASDDMSDIQDILKKYGIE